MSDYRKLDIWKRARALSIRVHHLVGKLPGIEQMRLGDQLIRAANSVRNNIVEGSGLGSDAQFARHLTYSIASANEVQDEVQGLADLGLLPVEDRDLLSEPSEIAAMIVSFRKRLLRDGRGR
jgi:four helix bundle protein